MRADLYPVRGLVLKRRASTCVGGGVGGASNGVSPITNAPLTLGVWTPPPLSRGGGVGSILGEVAVFFKLWVIVYSRTIFFKSHSLTVTFSGILLISFFGNWLIQIW